MIRSLRFVLLVLLAVIFSGCKEKTAPSPPLVTAARNQIGVTVQYNPAYEALAYPGGDVPIQRGVCTDVVIRALREAHGIDLQKEVHEDMKENFSVYPQLWNLKKADPHIDHRRVPNLQTWFRRKGWELPVTDQAGDYLPGDLVTCKVDSGRPHIMLVSDKKDGKGVPLVLHNIGHGTREESVLFYWKLTGHYRCLHQSSAPEGS
jgi:uncharacterized protein